ncbi:MAG: DEAD/DEAH box helicase, partial [Acidobacteriaceae bacterium]
YQVVCNVGIGVEGLDIPVISCVVLARPTKSLTLYLQAAGRGSRPAPDKTDLIILDHAGCAMGHGLVTEDREWTLESSVKRGKKKDREITVTICPKCFSAYQKLPGTRKCPSCGFAAPTQSREVEHVDGTLVEVDEAQMKLLRKMEIRKANTLDELYAMAQSRGYKKGWAEIMWSLKNRRKGGAAKKTG